MSNTRHCTRERHEAIKGNPISLRLYTDPLPGHTYDEPAVWDDGVERFALWNCRNCGSTLGVELGSSAAPKEAA